MKRDDCFKCRKYIAAKKRVCSIFDKFRARALQHPQIQTPCVYRMEFHLLNEREIKTIRPRVHQLAKPLASSRARARHSLIFTLGILDPETTFDSNVSFNFFARFFLFLRYLTFLFLHAASSSAPPPSPSPNLGSFHRLSFSLSLSLSPSFFLPTKRRRERESSSFLFSSYPFASSPFCALHRSCAHALPCFSRHFSPSQRVGVRLVLTLLGLFRLLHRRNIESLSGLSPTRAKRLAQVATVRELICLCSLSVPSTISHPV